MIPLDDVVPTPVVVARRRAIVRSHKSAGCVDCGYNVHPDCLEFDHLPSFKKKFNISRGMKDMTFSDVDFFAELDKCEVVCANCHRLRTRQRINERQEKNALRSVSEPVEAISEQLPPLTTEDLRPMAWTTRCCQQRLAKTAEHCTECCETFATTKAGDAHRVGEHGLDRRCLTVGEMIEAGLAKNSYGYWTTERSLRRGARMSA